LCIDLNRKIEYTYDRQGNILSKTDNGTQINYVYQEKTNKLIKFGSQEYSYDEIGNITNLNETYTSLSWSRGSLLTSMLAYNHGVSFGYSATGLLTSKSIASQNWRYFYEGDRLVRQLENSTTAIDFLYGQEGLLGFVYNGETYLYQKNIFGDIVKILNSAGSVVAEYGYTAFGECNVITNVNNIATINPFRYRGYLYEANSGLYYLKTRFYNPVTGRFISPDSTKYLQPNVINGLNLYAYCNNNPVMNIDPTGHFAITLTTLLIGGLIAGAIGAGIGFGTAVYKDVKEDGVWFNGDWTNYVGRTLGGFVEGFGVGICTILGAGVGAVLLGGTIATLFASTGLTLSLGTALGIGSGVAFATGMAGYAVRVGVSRSEDFKGQNMFVEGVFNAVSGALSVLGGFLGGIAGVHNTVFTKLLSRKGDFWLRLLIENGFTSGLKLANAIKKPDFMI